MKASRTCLWTSGLLTAIAALVSLAACTGETIPIGSDRAPVACQTSSDCMGGEVCGSNGLCGQEDAGSTPGSDCDALASAYEAALTAAAACNACGGDGCSAGPVYPTTHGCNVVLNFDNHDLIDTAKLAYWAWRDAGCVADQGTCAAGSPGPSSCAASAPSSCAGSCTPPSP